MAYAVLWVAGRLEESGLTLEQGASLAAIVIGRASAAKELQPAIPDAHTWHSESGDGKQYATWSDYFAASLSNRPFYFFQKHLRGQNSPAVAEWPARDPRMGCGSSPRRFPRYRSKRFRSSE